VVMGVVMCGRDWDPLQRSGRRGCEACLPRLVVGRCPASLIGRHVDCPSVNICVRVEEYSMDCLDKGVRIALIHSHIIDCRLL
jgi:hypothetical protein